MVNIRYRKRRFYCARAHNLSADGMYLDVRSVTLPTGTLVELELHTQGLEWLVPAVVVHHHGGGVGVMFREPQTHLFRHILHSPIPEVPMTRVGTASGQETGRRSYS